ncbi:MAG: hypothetical protein JXA14_08195 [Anaerolineae bacterium]|nr:hypothetical protein [Anaerolineae bacterium]
MFEQTIEMSATPHITIVECARNLLVQGKGGARVSICVDGDAKDLTLEQEGETLTLSAREDCEITCPTGSTLTVQTCHGNAKIGGVAGTIALETVHGNLTLKDVGPTEFTRVDGNLYVRDVGGILRGKTVGGNARVRDVQGECALEKVSGNLHVRDVDGDLRGETVGGNAQIVDVLGQYAVKKVGGNLTFDEVQGSVTAEQVGGNARVKPPFAPGMAYRVSASGNVDIHLPDDANLSLALRAGGGVHSRIEGLALEETGGEMKGVLGDGAASLEARAGGSITLRGWGTANGAPGEFEFNMDFLDDLENIGPMVEARVGEAMAELQVRLEQGLGQIDSDKLRFKIERAAEKSARAAERAAEEVRRAAEREAQKARMRAERSQRSWERASGQKPRPRPEPASQEEQLRVLRMVEQGKITPEQASDLLEALKGR